MKRTMMNYQSDHKREISELKGIFGHVKDFYYNPSNEYWVLLSTDIRFDESEYMSKTDIYDALWRDKGDIIIHSHVLQNNKTKKVNQIFTDYVNTHMKMVAKANPKLTDVELLSIQSSYESGLNAAQGYYEGK